MKTSIRLIVCVCLMAIAVTMVVFTMADFTPRDRQPQTEQGFVLGEYDGRLAIFGQGEEPISVTEIELGGLRAADREKVREGIPVTTQEELVALLEDLGS
ncbi:MAG: BofC C-terminal domain-containing protein [Oscillospiraceae bacterium]